MNVNLKRRLVVVSGIIVVVLVVVLAIVASTAGYQSITVAEALEGEQRDKRVQVSGEVVTDSYAIEGTKLSFSVYDPEGDPKDQLAVVYEGGVSATFGNGVTAICSGRINGLGVLECSELVTKCPSKYETATDALSVSQLLGYGASIEGKPLKVYGYVKPQSLGSVEAAQRLVLVDGATDVELPVLFTGAMPDTVGDNSVLVVTGSLNSSGQFNATTLALREE
ncbi:MAG: cytochrome c maturation protein CcmE [Coriobacteriales bacterium]|nr:cytochrome c maturation protein CcmE [Coriobacteriales bacterium]